MSNLPLSVVLISMNEAENLPRTLDALKDIAGEIIVVDSHSTDDTVKIAESYGAKVFVENWKGHVAQKNSALEKCSLEWILSLDCDEVLTSELREDIKDKVLNGDKDGYVLNRRTFYAGKMLKYSWQPDLKLRLVRKDKNAKWGGYDPHDSLKMEGTTGKLKGDVIHYSYKNIFDHYQRLVKYAKTAAESYDKNGKKFSMFKFLANPLFAFIKKYFFKLGFLDGFHGIVVAMSSFIYVFLKYLFLWEIQRGKK